LKIATLNINWAEKNKSKSHFKLLENFLNEKDFDFLILTEAINLKLKNFNFKYCSEQITENKIYEGLNYTEYLKGEKAFRTIIYSKKAALNKIKVKDGKTSCSYEFESEFGNIIIYATIIGTWFNKKPFAKIELENCIKDCEEIYLKNTNLIIIGDLNTSFLENEKNFSINKETTESLKKLIKKLNLFNATEDIEKNIDHIIIPKKLKGKMIKSDIFIKKDILSDHKGVYIELQYE
jgi:endonuclease/exonuclease/phosphatase family metal-dependent hydrolase